MVSKWSLGVIELNQWKQDLEQRRHQAKKEIKSKWNNNIKRKN